MPWILPDISYACPDSFQYFPALGLVTYARLWPLHVSQIFLLGCALNASSHEKLSHVPEIMPPSLTHSQFTADSNKLIDLKIPTKPFDLSSGSSSLKKIPPPYLGHMKKLVGTTRTQFNLPSFSREEVYFTAEFGYLSYNNYLNVSKKLRLKFMAKILVTFMHIWWLKMPL